MPLTKYTLCDLEWGYLTQSRDSLIIWSRDMQKEALSVPFLGQWPPILAKNDLSWVDHHHRVTWLIYHVITFYSRKGTSPVSQRQWPLNLVGLRVRVKVPHLLFQVTSSSVHQVITCFLRNIMYPLTQGHRTQLEISNIEKLQNQKLFLLFKRY